jgi:hypothetical protein
MQIVCISSQVFVSLYIFNNNYNFNIYIEFILYEMNQIGEIYKSNFGDAYALCALVCVLYANVCMFQNNK